MEASAETHQSISHRLQEGLVRPLKMLVDAQHRARKRVEAVVDKRAKALSEWRAAESKTKTKSYGTCRYMDVNKLTAWTWYKSNRAFAGNTSA